jgi:hypothetical protein
LITRLIGSIANHLFVSIIKTIFNFKFLLTYDIDGYCILLSCWFTSKKEASKVAIIQIDMTLEWKSTIDALNKVWFELET